MSAEQNLRTVQDMYAAFGRGDEKPLGYHHDTRMRESDPVEEITSGPIVREVQGNALEVART